MSFAASSTSLGVIKLAAPISSSTLYAEEGQSAFSEDMNMMAKLFAIDAAWAKIC